MAALICAPARALREPSAAAAPDAAEGQSPSPALKPSNIIEEVKRRKALHPALSAAGLARYANALLARAGFDYDFDVCEIFMRPELAAAMSGETLGTLTFRYRMVTLDGRGLMFGVVTDDRGGPCSECFLHVAALRVTKGEMYVVAGGVTYGLKRPASFALDEAHLVDADLKKILRTWQLPYQTIPAGVSPDGRSLYVDFYEDSGLGELVLEISNEGRPRFRVRREVVSVEGEWIEERPPDSLDDYPSFRRFRSGSRTHVVRFNGPCT